MNQEGERAERGLKFLPVCVYMQGPVGLSLGYGSEAYSFSGAWSTGSKLALIVIMILGRHRYIDIYQIRLIKAIADIYIYIYIYLHVHKPGCCVLSLFTYRTISVVVWPWLATFLSLHLSKRSARIHRQGHHLIGGRHGGLRRHGPHRRYRSCE